MPELNEAAAAARFPALDQFQRTDRDMLFLGSGKDAGQRLRTEVDHKIEVLMAANATVVD